MGNRSSIFVECGNAPLEDDRPHANVVSPVSDEMTIEFITDVEGNWEYFLHYVSKSSVLYFEGDEMGVWGPGTLTLHDNCMLVFGGDAVDKGTGDIRFTKTLLSLKERYWDRVFIILGNRDINKLRLYAELSFDEHFESFRQKCHENELSFLEYTQKHDLQRDQLSKLRWMLACTMGCGENTFQTRKMELAILSGKKTTDDDVLASFKQSIDPQGADPFMLKLLLVGQLMIVIGETLFVHAGIQEDSLGFVPGSEILFDNVPDWAAALNSWKSNELKAFLSQPGWSKGTRGAGDLISYASPDGGTKTVVYFNPLHNGNTQLLSPAVESFLSRSNIRRLLTGHQPHGQSPAVARHPRSGLLTVSCDTSFSNMGAPKHLNRSNNRGEAVCVVSMQGSTLKVTGEEKNGEKHGFRLDSDISACSLPDALVGMQLSCGSWIKTVSNQTVIAAIGKTFKVRVMAVHPGHAAILLKPDFKQTLQLHKRELSELVEEWVAPKLRDNELCITDDAVFSSSELWSKPFNRKEFEEADTYIFAISGVITHLASPELQKRAVDKVNGLIAAGKRVVLNATSTEWSRASLQKEISNLGINISKGPHAKKDNVVTVSKSCAFFMQLMGIKRPFLLCSSKGLVDEIEAVGIKDYVATVDETGKTKQMFLQEATQENIVGIMNELDKLGGVDAIVAGVDRSNSALKTSVAAAYLKWNHGSGKNLPLIACSQEHDHFLGLSTESQFPKKAKYQNRVLQMPGSGAVCDVICRTVDIGLEPYNVGKPGAFLADLMQRPEAEGGYGISFARSIVVGHQLETDVAFAQLCGMKSLLVCTGATHDVHLASLKSMLDQKPDTVVLDHVPTWILDNLGDI